MVLSDFNSIISWWFIVFIIGLSFLPSTFLLFKSFFDKGYVFSKILGLLLTGYLVWVIASLKIFPFNNFLIIGGLGISVIFNFKLMHKFKLLPDLKKYLKLFFAEEFLFTAGFIFWNFIKSYEPSIHGLEKFMDYGFINTILRSEYFPPKDMWLSGFTINYYYFGHFLTAFLIKLSGVASETGYNLMLTTIFGFCLAASFSLGANLYYLFAQRISKNLILAAGFLSSFLVTLGGNLHTIYIFFSNYQTDDPVPFWQLPMQLNLNGYWYPNATRFIPFTIHEFPIYSFVVSDLHGHVLDIPFVLLLVALLVVTFFQEKLRFIYLCLISLLISVFLMTNVLDGPIYLLIISILLLAREYRVKELKLKFESFIRVFQILLLIIFMAFVFSLPYWLSFKPFGSGIGVSCPPSFLSSLGQFGPFIFDANHCARSPLWMLLILWGFPVFIVISFIFSKVKFKKGVFVFEEFSVVDNLVLTLSLSAFILILIPEYFYVKDIYPAHWRANTVFKFGYQAFILLGLSSGYLIVRLLPQFKKYFWLSIITSLLFTFVAIYPFFAVNSYFDNLENYSGLNGLNWISKTYPSDFEAITWINKNIPGQPVILEGQGESYSDFARVSSFTGLPTVIGWTVHEWLWRGSYDEAGKRVVDVTDLYESPDINLTKQLINKYKIEYIFIGTLEKQKYTKLDESKFKTLGEVVFKNGNTKIYQIQ